MPPSIPSSLAATRKAFRIRWFDPLFSLLLAAAAFALLHFFRNPAPFPGEAERSLATLSGLWPRMTAAAPLWNRLAPLCLRDTPEASFAALQTLAFLFTALSTAFFHFSALFFLLGSQTNHSETRWTPLFCRLGALSGTALYLALPPIWHAAQAPSAASLGLALTALTALLLFLLSNEETTSIPLRLLCPPLAALALFESPVALFAIPLLALFRYSTSLGVEQLSMTLLDEDEKPTSSATDDEPPPSLLHHPAVQSFITVLQVLSFLAVLLYGASLALRDLQAVASYRLTTTFSQTLVLFLKDLYAFASDNLPAAGAYPLAALVILPAVAILAISRRCLSGDQRPADSLAFALTGALLLLQTTRIPTFSIWTLSPSPAIIAGFAFLAALLFPPCVAAFFVKARTVWTHRHGNPDETDWDNPTPPNPHIQANLAAFFLVLALAFTTLPFARLASNPEAPTRQALATLDAYTRALATDLGPCHTFVSDGFYRFALRLRRPDLLYIPFSDLDTPPSELPGDSLYLSTLLPDPYSRALLSAPDGWPLFLNDTLVYSPSNTFLTAIQTGTPLWNDAERHFPHLTLHPNGLLLRPTQSASAPTNAPAFQEWSATFAALPPVLYPSLSSTLQGLQSRLSTLSTPLTSLASPRKLSPLDFLASLPPPLPASEPRTGLRSGALHPSLASDLLAIARSALTNASPDSLQLRFDTLLAKLRETEPPPLPDYIPEDFSQWRKTEVDNPEADPTARLLDLVHAYILLRVTQDPTRAEEILTPYHYHSIHDPAFWYVWGLLKSDLDNPFGIMESKEWLERFQKHAILRSTLDLSIARSTSDIPLELNSIRACLSDIPSDTLLLHRALRLQLQIPENPVSTLRLAIPHARRILARDASDPLAHLVLTLYNLTLARTPDPALASAHLQRALLHLPETARAPFLPLAETLASGTLPDPTALPTLHDFLLADQSINRLHYTTESTYLFHLGLLLQHIDPAAINSRYVYDSLRRR